MFFVKIESELHPTDCVDKDIKGEWTTPYRAYLYEKQ